jgi:hypothetical protein
MARRPPLARVGAPGAIAPRRAQLCVSADAIEGPTQASGAFEIRVGAEFERLVHSPLEGAARDVCLVRRGRSIVRRIRPLKAACLACPENPILGT